MRIDAIIKQANYTKDNRDNHLKIINHNVVNDNSNRDFFSR